MSYDIGVASIAKMGEELCGDSVEIKKSINSTIVVLSDGLGSGVKANILSTLTSKIAAKLLAEGVPVPEVVNTIKDTLPVCQVRQLAYATCTMLEINDTGKCYIAQFDNPPVLFLRDSEVIQLTGSKSLNVANRNIQESRLQLIEEDMLIMISDGVTHAGIEALLPLGLGIDGLIDIIKNKIDKNLSAQEFSEEIVEYCEAYCTCEPKDDITVVVIKARKPVKGVMLSGPPLNEIDDAKIVEKFFSGRRKRVVCGGTTANIVSREKNTELKIDLSYIDPHIPPCAELEDVDLVTEGILTISRVVECFEKGEIAVKNKKDGASKLIRWLLDCDEIEFLVGLSVNPSHLKPNTPWYLNLRSSLLERLREQLIARGKKVDITWF